MTSPETTALPIPTIYRTEVVVVFTITAPASSPQEAEEVARRRALDHRVAKAEIVEATAVPVELDAQITAQNVAIWQEHEALKHATVNQRQRHSAGLLPDDEIADIARAQLFLPFVLFTRRQKLRPSAIPHPRLQSSGKIACGDDPNVRWDTCELGRDSALTQDQWNTVLRLEAALKEMKAHPWLAPSLSSAVRVCLREHVGTCLTCDGWIRQQTALVEVDWAGRTLSREYVL